MRLLYFALVGLIAGAIADSLILGDELGLLGQMALGMAGAVVGGWVFERAGMARGRPGCLLSIVSAFVGAAILLVLVSLIRQGA